MDNEPKDLKIEPHVKLSPRQEVLAFIWETVKIIIISLAIIIPVRYYLVQPFFVKGASMEHTFEDGDYILIDEISYRFNEPQRGDIVVFRFPEDHSQFFIKRIIGLPGETVVIQNDQVKVFNVEHKDGLVLPEPYLSQGEHTLGDLRVKLDEKEYFVLGDNRLQSSDSRRWGPLNRTLITGRVFARAWPIDTIKLFKGQSY